MIITKGDMTTASGASLRISLKINDTFSELTLESANNKIEVKSNDLNQQNLPEVRNYIRNTLIEVKDTIGGLEPSWENVQTAIVKLHNCGRSLLCLLFEQDLWKIDDAVTLCREACPTWQKCDRNDDVINDNPLLRPRLIEFCSLKEDIIPVELLPLFNFKRQDTIEEDNFKNLASVAHSFLGFSAIIRRIIRRLKTSYSSDTLLDNDPRLPIKFFHHEELSGAGEELKFFQKTCSNQIDLDGPWPNKTQDLLRIPVAQALAEYIWNSQNTFSGDRRITPDQILHFSCHCSTNQAFSQNYEIILAKKNRIMGLERLLDLGCRECHITIGELNNELMDRRDYQKSKPLVFLNACGAGEIDPTKVCSFPKFFLDYGFLGFIGPQIPIYDSFAAAFSKKLYTELLKGCPLGLALYKARWQMMKRYNNPLGILYSIYADPAIRVRKPVNMN
jgi:hypothetical protein